MMRILVHVEGHTEEEFVNSALVVVPHLYSKGFASVSARLIGRSRSRKRRGACPWPKLDFVQKSLTSTSRKFRLS